MVVGASATGGPEPGRGRDPCDRRNALGYTDTLADPHGRASCGARRTDDAWNHGHDERDGHGNGHGCSVCHESRWCADEYDDLDRDVNRDLDRDSHGYLATGAYRWSATVDGSTYAPSGHGSADAHFDTHHDARSSVRYVDGDAGAVTNADGDARGRAHMDPDAT